MSFQTSPAVKNAEIPIEIKVIEAAKNAKANISQKEIVFENVSFTYDTDSFSKIKSEIVKAQPLEDATAKPDSVYSQHIRHSR